MVLSRDGLSLFLADSANNKVRVLDLKGRAVRTLAGSGVRGNADGGAKEAQFSRPHDVALSADGSVLYVADGGNGRLRAVMLQADPLGKPAAADVGTIAGAAATMEDLTKPSLPFPSALAVGAGGDKVFVAARDGHSVCAVAVPAGDISAVAGLLLAEWGGTKKPAGQPRAHHPPRKGREHQPPSEERLAPPREERSGGKGDPQATKTAKQQQPQSAAASPPAGVAGPPPAGGLAAAGMPSPPLEGAMGAAGLGTKAAAEAEAQVAARALGLEFSSFNARHNGDYDAHEAPVDAGDGDGEGVLAVLWAAAGAARQQPEALMGLGAFIGVQPAECCSQPPVP